MTNTGQAETEALTITAHSRPATDTEILTTEFIACYLTANMAWHHDSDHQELKKASEGTQWEWLGKWKGCGRWRSNVTEDIILEFRSPMRGLTCQFDTCPVGDLILTSTSTDTDPARFYTWTQHQNLDHVLH